LGLLKRANYLFEGRQWASHMGQVRECFLVAVAFAEYCVRSRSTKPELQMARTKKKIVRRAWTKDDVRQLKTMAKAKAGVTKISKSLKRTSGATSVMATKLGVSLSMRA